MPACSIDKHYNVSPVVYFLADFLQEAIHDASVEAIKNKRTLFAIFRVNRADKICALESILPNDLWPIALDRPQLGYHAFLAEARLVLEPDLDFFAGMERAFLGEERFGFFFHFSITKGSFFG